MARASLYQVQQIMTETTHGTTPGSPVYKRLHNVQIQPTPDRKVKPVRYPGAKAATDVQLGRGMTAHKIAAAMDFNLMAIFFTSIFGAATITTPANATNARLWSWVVSATNPIIPKSWVMQQGTTAGAEQYNYVQVSELGLKWGDNDASMDGSLFSHLPQRDITPASPGSTIASAAVSPQRLGAYLSTDGGTVFNPLAKNMGMELNFNGLWKPVHHSSDTTTEFDDTVEATPSFSGMITEEESTGGEVSSLITHLNAGDLVHVGYQGTGRVLDVADGITLMADILQSVKIQAPYFVIKDDPKDDNSVYVNAIGLENGFDNTFGLVKIQIVCGLTASP